MIYTIGFLVMLAARAFYAGMKQYELFYKAATDYEVRYSYKNVKKGEPILVGEKVFNYVAISLALILLWPIAVPAVGLFMLGQKYAKTTRSNV